MNMKLAAKIMGKVGLVGFIGFVATFTIYFFNLENKLRFSGARQAYCLSFAQIA